MVDFHSHSTASDGMLTPSALVALAFRRGLTALALTDHDTVAGLDEASMACRRLGLRFVPGIELEVDYEGGEFHLLGLGLRQWSSGWVDGLEAIQGSRLARNRRMFAKMTEAGIKGEYSEIEALAAGGQVGRPHFARFLVNRGKVETIQEAFTHFLGRGQLFHEAKAAFSLADALSMIHEAGGLAILAHPKTLRIAINSLPARLEEWKRDGLDGLEAWHPGAEPRVARRYEAMARTAGLKVSAGSDYHGDNRPDRQLGLTSGGNLIDERFWDYLFADREAVVS